MRVRVGMGMRVCVCACACVCVCVCVCVYLHACSRRRPSACVEWQARKIEDVAVPFQYSQAISAFLGVFSALFPIVLARYANGETATIWVGPLIAFVTVSSYTTLHKVARAAWRTRAHHGMYMCIPCAGWAGIGACTHT